MVPLCRSHRRGTCIAPAMNSTGRRKFGIQPKSIAYKLWTTPTPSQLPRTPANIEALAPHPAAIDHRHSAHHHSRLQIAKRSQSSHRLVMASPKQLEACRRNALLSIGALINPASSHSRPAWSGRTSNRETNDHGHKNHGATGPTLPKAAMRRSRDISISRACTHKTRHARTRHSASWVGKGICVQNCLARLNAQDDRLAARSRSTRSVTSRAIATEPITSPSTAPLTIAKVISTYSLRPLLCSARVSVGRP